MHGIFRQQVTFRILSLDEQFTEILVDKQFLLMHTGFEGNLDNLRLSVRVRCEIEDPASFLSLGKIILTVACHTGHIEPLDEIEALAPVAVHHIIDGTTVVLLEYRQVDDVLSHEDLVCHADNLILTVAVEDNDIVDVGTVAHKLILLQTCTDESVLSVDIQFLVGLGHLCCLNGIEVTDFCKTRMVGSVFILQVLEPLDGDTYHVRQFIVDIGNLVFQAENQFIGLITVELQDSCHLDVHELEDIVLAHLTDHLRIVRCQPVVDMLTGSIHGWSLLELLVLIDTLFDEDLLQRAEMQLLQQLVLADFQFLP